MKVGRQVKKIIICACGFLLATGMSMAGVVDKAQICEDDVQASSLKISADIEKACFASYADVANTLNQLTIIDTRLSDDYEQYFIPGSLNIPANQIKLKKYLQQDSLLIIGNGFDDSAMLGLCSSLTNKNFKHVQVLTGGMLAWVAHGGAISGFPPSKGMVSAKAADVSREYNAHRAVLISLNSDLQKQMQQLGYDTVLLPNNANKAFSEWFKTAHAEKSSYPVFIGTAKEIDKQKKEMAGKNMQQTAFYLDDAYAALVENKKQIEEFARQRKESEHLGAVCGR